MPLVRDKKKRIDWVEVKARLAQSQAGIEAAFVHEERDAEKIYQERALQLAARRESESRSAEVIRALVVMLGEERYGLELNGLIEVLPFTNCSPVPGGPSELAGVINRRGEIRAVIGLSRLLGLAGSASSDTGGGYVVMLRTDAGEVGLQVDQVERIAFVDTATLIAPSDAITAREGYVRGVSSEGLIVLNPSVLFTYPVFQNKGFRETALGTA
jgi:chemotaxis signal transduction protein